MSIIKVTIIVVMLAVLNYYFDLQKIMKTLRSWMSFASQAAFNKSYYNISIMPYCGLF